METKYTDQNRGDIVAKNKGISASEPENIILEKPYEPVVKSAKLVRFEEFIVTKGIRREVAAGFKVSLNDKLWNSPEAWEKLYQEYLNR